LENWLSKLHDMAEVPTIQSAPRIFPGIDSLSDTRMARGEVKAEFAGWRDGSLMHVCQTRS
jgi:hypothetical protein